MTNDDDQHAQAAHQQETDELVAYLRHRCIALNAAVRRLSAQVAELQQQEDGDGLPGDSEHGDQP